DGITIDNARESKNKATYTRFLYERLQRQGHLLRDCQRMVNLDRNIFASCMVAHGHADAMVTGLTRNYHTALAEVCRVIDVRPGAPVYGLSMVVMRGRTLFIADTAVNERPTPEQLVQIATESAATAKRLGHEPRVALLS